jgi:hypothetical protein
VPGRRIDLSRELRHPEVVDDIGRLDGDEQVAPDRDVNLVGRDGTRRVANFPPPLVRDDGDVGRPVDCRIGRRHRLDRAHE